MRSCLRWLWKSVLQAVGFLLPLGVTTWVLVWLFKYFRRFLEAFNILSLWIAPKDPMMDFWLSLGSFVFLLLLVLLVGVIFQGIVGRWLHSTVDNLMATIPGINTFYRAVKQLLAFLFKEEKKTVGDVVMVQAFHKKVYSLGFVMGYSNKLDPSGKTWVKVFVPGVPNISSGFVILVDEKDMIKLSTTVDQASAFLVSLGVLNDMRRKV